MNLMKGFNLGATLTTFFDMFAFNTQNPGSDGNEPFNLKFHLTRGKAINLNNDASIAKRDACYFEHSVVFSHRPININEIIAVEILETSSEFHGPLRIGFTTYNPLTFQDSMVPLGRDLKNLRGFWIKSVQLHPLKVGTVIYFKVDQNGVILYGVDGENAGVFMKDVDIAGQLWVMLEAYGSVQAFRFVDKNMELQYCSSGDDSDVNDNSTLYRRVPNSTSRRYRLTSRSRPLNLPLSARRNVMLAPLTYIGPPKSLISPTSPCTPAFGTPLSPNQHQLCAGLCIICTEREKNTAFTKCGHVCMCFECAEEFRLQNRGPGTHRNRKRNLCPICRKPITSTLRVYM